MIRVMGGGTEAHKCAVLPRSHFTLSRHMSERRDDLG
jgi:hypothetical protein